MTKSKLASLLFILSIFLCFTPWGSSAIALVGGTVLAIVFGNPFLEWTKAHTHRVLSWSIIGLGAGMNLSVIAKVGLQGIGYTIIGIALAFIMSFLLRKWLETPRDTSLLITVGTAICGGSAIAAVAPAIKAKSHEVSVALGVVFLLNALALVIFPSIGHGLNLSQSQFGLWAALAIHDTSSVVGASMQFGPEALSVGTTVKLARALWIIPLVMMISLVRKDEVQSSQATEKTRRPWFILGFITAAALVTIFPILAPYGAMVEKVSKKFLVVALFLIGSNLSLSTIKSVGIRPLIHAVLLWFLMASIFLFAVKSEIISYSGLS